MSPRICKCTSEIQVGGHCCPPEILTWGLLRDVLYWVTSLIERNGCGYQYIYINVIYEKHYLGFAAFATRQDSIQSAQLQRSGSGVIKLFPCSTQLSTKFILLINMKMPTIVNCQQICMQHNQAQRL